MKLQPDHCVGTQAEGASVVASHLEQKSMAEECSMARRQSSSLQNFGQGLGVGVEVMVDRVVGVKLDESVRVAEVVPFQEADDGLESSDEAEEVLVVEYNGKGHNICIASINKRDIKEQKYLQMKQRHTQEGTQRQWLKTIYCVSGC